MHLAFRKNRYSEFSFHADFKYVFVLLKWSLRPQREPEGKIINIVQVTCFSWFSVIFFSNHLYSVSSLSVLSPILVQIMRAQTKKKHSSIS